VTGDGWVARDTQIRYGPPQVGATIALDHSVWRVEAVEDVPLTGDEVETWARAQSPDPTTWAGRPYILTMRHLGGVYPNWVTSHIQVTQLAAVRVQATISRAGAPWMVYPPTGRWPMCSCCGEPMPCRAELEDRLIAVANARVEAFSARLPGCCWACGEPITDRQRTVTYDGDNLDMPGAAPPVFHTRNRCWAAAAEYERRWVAVSPSHERVLTYPACSGVLVVHDGGTGECRAMRGKPSSPDCVGHLSHDHILQVGCPGECPRGCAPGGRRSVADLPARPDRRR
jgi:hypothetical protein